MLGMSRPGFRKDYDKNQLLWISKIYGVSSWFSSDFSKQKNVLSLQDLYTILGSERNKIAKELNQGNLHKFGVLRKIGQPAREFMMEEDSIMSLDKTHMIIDQLFRETHKYLTPVPKLDLSKASLYFKETPEKRGVDIVLEQTDGSDEELLKQAYLYINQRLSPQQQLKKISANQKEIPFPELVMNYDQGSVLRINLNSEEITDLSPAERPHKLPKSIPLSHLFLFVDSKTQNKSGFLIYGSTRVNEATADSMDKHLISLAEAYMAKAAQEPDPEKCRVYLAKFMYIQAHTIPVKRGNASVIEIACNAIADKMGHSFVLQLDDKDPNWDIQALFCQHSMTDFVKWAEDHIKILKPEVSNVIKSLKLCEAQLAQTVNDTNDAKAIAELKITQECLGAIMKKENGEENLSILLRGISEQYKPTAIIADTDSTILKHLSKSLFDKQAQNGITVEILQNTLNEILAPERRRKFKY